MAIIPTELVPYVATFLFTFAVVFGLLVYSKVGTFTKRINAMIAGAIALFAIMYQPLVVGMTQYMPIAIAILIPLFFLIFVKKIVEGGAKVDTFPMIVSLGFLFIVLYLFQDKIVAMVPAGIDGTNLLWILGIAAAIMFFWLIYKTKSE